MKRREFLQLAATLSAGFGIANLPKPVMAALKKIPHSSLPVIVYLQGQSCTGCSISLLQAASPSPDLLITDFSKLGFHADLSAASGKKALDLIQNYISGNAGPYYLALEGSIPEKMPEACVIGNKPIAEWVMQASNTMSAAVAIGSCATTGGIPAAEGNLTGAMPLMEFFKKNNINKTVINIPGCAVHPDWLWQTIIHLVKVGMPSIWTEAEKTINKEIIANSPKQFFGKRLHEQCPRYHDFQEEIFAENVGDSGCLFKIGCSGPITFADCPKRWWNNGTTWCVDANAPCIGCASATFARKKDYSFYRINTQFAYTGEQDEN